MTYNPNAPQPSDTPNVEYAQVQTNFSQFNSIFSNTIAGIIYNHMPLNDFNQGKHGAVIFQNQSSDPNTIGNSDIIYSKSASSMAGTEPQLFLKIPQFLPTSLDTTPATNNPMQLTYNQVNTTGPSQYQSFMIGGYLLFFGNASLTGASPVTATVTLSPSPTKILCVQAVPQGVGVNNTPYDHQVIVTQPNSFVIKSVAALNPSTFLWLAIGSV